MDHALVQHLASSFAVALLLAGCIGAKGNERQPPPTKRTAAYVSPTGSDSASGEREMPYRTIAKALESDLERIVLLRGAHDEERIEIDRAVVIEGDGPVVVRGHVFVTGNGVALRGLSIGGGLAAQFVENLLVENATVSAGAKDEAVALTRSSAAFSRVELSCGAISCLQATTATVTIEDCVAIGSGETKRVLRFDGSKASVHRSRLQKSSIAHLQATRSRVEVTGTSMVGGGNGVVVIQGALVAKDVTVEGASNMALVAQRAKLTVEESSFGRTLDQTIGLSGVDATFTNTIVEGSPKGTVSITNHLQGEATVRFEGGEIRHGSASGLLIGSGEVTIAGVRFAGDPKAKGDGNDAITAHGVDAKVRVESAVFESPGGFAVAFHSDATGSVTATISHPRMGGVLVEDVAVEPITIAGSVIEGCAAGSGVVAQEATKVVIDRTRVLGCKEAGVLAGAEANVVISSSAFANNAMYGCAAFGGAIVEISGTRILGSKFATFASCGNGARVEDRGDNRFDGSVSSCP